MICIMMTSHFVIVQGAACEHRISNCTTWCYMLYIMLSTIYSRLRSTQYLQIFVEYFNQWISQLINQSCRWWCAIWQHAEYFDLLLYKTRQMITYYCVIMCLIMRSTCNSRDTLLAEALIYCLRGHYIGLRRKSGLIRYIRADIGYISPDIANQPALQILRNWY